MSTPAISPNCIRCKAPHTQEHLAFYAEQSAKRGHVNKTGGIMCAECFLLAVVEMGDEEG